MFRIYNILKILYLDEINKGRSSTLISKKIIEDHLDKFPRPFLSYKNKLKNVGLALALIILEQIDQSVQIHLPS